MFTLPLPLLSVARPARSARRPRPGVARPGDLPDHLLDDVGAPPEMRAPAELRRDLGRRALAHALTGPPW